MRENYYQIVNCCTVIFRKWRKSQTRLHYNQNCQNDDEDQTQTNKEEAVGDLTGNTDNGGWCDGQGAVIELHMGRLLPVLSAYLNIIW